MEAVVFWLLPKDSILDVVFPSIFGNFAIPLSLLLAIPQGIDVDSNNPKILF